MSETRHTPGPWYWDSRNGEDYLVTANPDQDYTCIAGFCGGLHIPEDERGRSDARLIASAPDLYAALVSARTRIESEWGECDDKAACASYPCLLCQIDAALAKARGAR